MSYENFHSKTLYTLDKFLSCAATTTATTLEQKQNENRKKKKCLTNIAVSRYTFFCFCFLYSNLSIVCRLVVVFCFPFIIHIHITRKNSIIAFCLRLFFSFFQFSIGRHRSKQYIVCSKSVDLYTEPNEESKYVLFRDESFICESCYRLS